MSAFFSIAGVSKRFRGLVAVDNVSCEVVRGEIFAVIGPNGAGKTTLFNMVAGALRPDEGAIAFRASASTDCARTKSAAAASRARSRSCGRFRR